MIDLDTWTSAADWIRKLPPGHDARFVSADPEEVDALVAELRAAREVVEAFCTYRDHRGDRPLGRLLDALAAYDKAMGGK